VPSLSVPTGAPEDTLTIHDVTDFPSLVRFAQQKQQPGLPSNLRQVIRYLHGGVNITMKKLITWAKELGVCVHTDIQTSTRSRTHYQVGVEVVKYELQLHCFRLATVHTAAAEGNTVLQPECARTPLSLKVLAATLRDLSGRATCPFGADFMSDSNELAPRQLVRLKPQLVHLLALMELHQNGYRYAAEYNQKSLPLSYAALAEEVHRQRAAAAPVHD
jgi:hypothetical protein